MGIKLDRRQFMKASSATAALSMLPPVLVDTAPAERVVYGIEKKIGAESGPPTCRVFHIGFFQGYFCELDYWMHGNADHYYCDFTTDPIPGEKRYCEPAHLFSHDPCQLNGVLNRLFIPEFSSFLACEPAPSRYADGNRYSIVTAAPMFNHDFHCALLTIRTLKAHGERVFAVFTVPELEEPDEDDWLDKYPKEHFKEEILSVSDLTIEILKSDIPPIPPNYLPWEIYPECLAEKVNGLLAIASLNVNARYSR